MSDQIEAAKLHLSPDTTRGRQSTFETALSALANSITSAKAELGQKRGRQSQEREAHSSSNSQSPLQPNTAVLPPVLGSAILPVRMGGSPLASHQDVYGSTDGLFNAFNACENVFIISLSEPKKKWIRHRPRTVSDKSSPPPLASSTLKIIVFQIIKLSYLLMAVYSLYLLSVIYSCYYYYYFCYYLFLC